MARVKAGLALTADLVTSAFVEDGERLAGALGPRAMTRTLGGASLLVTGVPMPTLNGVITVRGSATAADVGSLLDIVAGRDVPHSIQIRPDCARDVTSVPVQRGMVEDEPVPLMAMPRDMDRLRAAAGHAELSIRILDPDEAAIHATVAAEGFEAPRELFEQLVPPALLKHAWCRAYVGMVDGKPVTTALGFRGRDSVGIFDVATPPHQRGRGYGGAITARAALDGFEEGASFAYLQSSPIGFKIYERLGFQTLETWSVWVTPGSDSH